MKMRLRVGCGEVRREDVQVRRVHAGGAGLSAGARRGAVSQDRGVWR